MLPRLPENPCSVKPARGGGWLSGERGRAVTGGGRGRPVSRGARRLAGRPPGPGGHPVARRRPPGIRVSPQRARPGPLPAAPRAPDGVGPVPFGGLGRVRRLVRLAHGLLRGGDGLPLPFAFGELPFALARSARSARPLWLPAGALSARRCWRSARSAGAASGRCARPRLGAEARRLVSSLIVGGASPGPEAEAGPLHRPDQGPRRAPPRPAGSATAALRVAATSSCSAPGASGRPAPASACRVSAAISSRRCWDSSRSLPAVQRAFRGPQTGAEPAEPGGASGSSRTSRLTTHAAGSACAGPIARAATRVAGRAGLRREVAAALDELRGIGGVQLVRGRLARPVGVIGVPVRRS